jgi:hypothetical protein
VQSGHVQNLPLLPHPSTSPLEEGLTFGPHITICAVACLLPLSNLQLGGARVQHHLPGVHCHFHHNSLPAPNCLPHAILILNICCCARLGKSGFRDARQSGALQSLLPAIPHHPLCAQSCKLPVDQRVGGVWQVLGDSKEGCLGLKTWGRPCPSLHSCSSSYSVLCSSCSPYNSNSSS